MTYDHLGAGPETLARSGRRRAHSAEALKAAKHPLIIVGPGRAVARADGARRAVAAPPRRRSAVGAVDGRLERLLRAAHRGLARRRPRHRLRAGRGRARCAPDDGRAARSTLLVPARRRRDRRRRPAPFVVYIGTHGDAARTAPTSSCRARPTPRSPAPTSTPRAGCSSATRAGFPLGRGAGGLGDPARAVRSCSASRLPFDSLQQLRATALCRPIPTSRAIEHGRRQPTRRAFARCAASRRSPDKAPFRRAVDGLLPDQPDRPRVRGHGRMLGAGAGAALPSRQSDGTATMESFSAAPCACVLMIVVQEPAAHARRC